MISPRSRTRQRSRALPASIINGSILTSSERSLFFDSSLSQRVNVGTAADIQFAHTSNFSILFLFKAVTPTGSNRVLITNMNVGTSNRGIEIMHRLDGKIFVELRSVAGTNRYIRQTVNSYGDNLWRMALVTWNGTTLNIRIENIIDNDTVDSNLTTTIASSEPWIFGGRPTGTNHIDGHLGRVAIWNTHEGANASLIYNNGVLQDYSLLASPAIHQWTWINESLEDTGTSATNLTATLVNAPVFSTDVYPS